MAVEKRQVTANILNVRSGPGTTYGKVSSLSKNNLVTVYDVSSDKMWVKISATEQKWIYKTYTKTISSSDIIDEGTKTKTTNTTTSATDETNGSETENLDLAVGLMSITGQSNASYKKYAYRLIRAFGSPPRFNSIVDPVYSTKSGGSTIVGHTTAEHWLTLSSVFSIAPGTVDYLPGFSSRNKETFFNRVSDIIIGDNNLSAANLANDDDKLNGKLYEFKSAYGSYMNHVNAIARTMAIYSGIGDEIVPGTQIKFKNMDWAYWNNLSNATTKGWKSIFEETSKSLSSAMSDSNYIHFFNNQGGASVSENIQTNTSASVLEEAFNNSELSSAARNIQFLFGGAIGGEENADIEKAIQDASSNGAFLGSLANLAKNYVKGGRIVFPQMIDGMDYSKSVRCTIKFVSASGDPISRFLRTLLPVAHLMPLALPKSVGQNMYTYPYICRCYQKGWYNSDLSVISNLSLSRGGSDDLSWTMDSASSEIEASFDIIPLYSSLMVSSSTTPFQFLQNTSLVEYIATMCGVDLKLNNLDAKIEMATNLLTSKFTDIPTNIGRSVMDTKVINRVRDFITITN